MSEVQSYGSVSWDDLDFNKQNTGNNFNKRDENLFLKLQKGDNIVRVVTDPKLYVFHNWTPEGENVDKEKVAKKAKFGFSVRCSAPHGSCPLCDAGVKTKEKYMIGVLTGKGKDSEVHTQFRILDAASSITKQLKTYKDNKKWGALVKYDVNIFKKENVDPQNMYTVMPDGAPTALSESELKLINDFDTSLLTKQTIPVTPESVQDSMDRILKSVAKDSGEAKTESPTATTGGKVSTDFPAL